MKKLMMIMFTGCVVVISLGFKQATAEQGGTPPEKLAGTYSVTVHGSVFYCFDPSKPGFPPAQCGSPGSVGVPLNTLTVGTVTSDDKGSYATFTETITDIPVNANGTGVVVLHSVSKVTNYDPKTGTGDASFTDYFGGQCHGAVFDSTGATVNDTGTNHFAVSDRGKRIDFVVTSLHSNPEGAFGGFSISGTDLRQ